MTDGGVRVERVGDASIITPTSHPSIGTNIQGPSVIRAPAWLADPLGRYLCYFADHKGSFIRLAYADAIEGPWTIHEPGSLRLAVELAAEFHKRHGRRIGLDHLRRQVSAATLALKSASLQAQADKAAHDWRSEKAGLAVEAAHGLADYLDQSRRDAAHG